MTHLRVRLLVAAALAGLSLGTQAAGVSAECGNLAVDPVDRLNVGAAFSARVTEASDDVDPNPIALPWEWHLELSVEDSFYGPVPDQLSFNGYEGGCAEFRGEALQTGDRIIIAV